MNGDTSIEDCVTRFLDACPLFDFRIDGMGFFGSILYLSVLIWAFGSKYVMTEKRK